ncbi:MAG: hypothetical protein IJO87_03600, partial [Eggerthellaceae bacterium]|nr:hypothetical protein [Eggerthellaceae bacterium]
YDDYSTDFQIRLSYSQRPFFGYSAESAKTAEPIALQRQDQNHRKAASSAASRSEQKGDLESCK